MVSSFNHSVNRIISSVEVALEKYLTIMVSISLFSIQGIVSYMTHENTPTLTFLIIFLNCDLNPYQTVGKKVDFSNEWILKNELQKGNHEALVFLMDTYHQALCLYVHSLSNDYELAQDIVQNIFIKIWEDRHKIRSVRSIKSFLYKSVYNRFANQWRKDKRMLAIEEKHLEALDHLFRNEDEDVLKRQIKLVKLEIQKLPPKCKETFLLSKQEGLTNIEIANFMNVSIRTVESQMNKAFRILREKLKDKIKPILFLLFGLDSSFKNFGYGLHNES